MDRSNRNESSVPPDRQGAWSRYWATGATASCQGDAGTGGLDLFWAEVFGSLPQQAHWLDLATGNGPLPQRWCRQNSDPAGRCTAVDLAHIRPQWLATQVAALTQRIEWLGGVDMCHLPWDTARFDLVASQFGVEYVDPAAVLPQILKVLKVGGRVALVMHHTESLVVSQAREELTHLDFLEQKDGLLDAIAAMLPLMAQAATPQGRQALASDPLAGQCRSEFNGAQQRTGERAQASACPDLLRQWQDRAMALLAQAGQKGWASARATLADARRDLQDHRLRLDELVQHALTDQQVQAWAQALCATGGSAQVAPILERGQIMAWGLQVQLAR